MSETTSISWTDATFNPWWGCVKVSPACDHCYAESFAKSKGFRDLWGSSSHTRRFFGEKHWHEPIVWNRKAEKAGKKLRVFCGSMCDVFENAVIDQELGCRLNSERDRLWELIQQTPSLEWILLTKRPENIERLIYYKWNNHIDVPENVRIMVTAENQEMIDKRIHLLLQSWGGKNGVSIEPMLGEIEIYSYLVDPFLEARCIDWVICGGESGSQARPLDPRWVKHLRNQCVNAEIPFHFKQWGQWFPLTEKPGKNFVWPVVPRLWCFDDFQSIYVGDKTKAGCFLDGVEWKEFPKEEK